MDLAAAALVNLRVKSLNRPWYNSVLAAARRWSIGFGALAGLVLLVVAAFLRPATWVPDLSLAAGASLVAAAAFVFLALPKDEFVERLGDLGLENVFLNRDKEFGDNDWLDFVKGAKHHYRVLGTGNHGYINSTASAEKFGPAFRDAIERRRVEVELLWLNPESELAARRENEERRGTRSDAIEAMEWFFNLRQSLNDAGKQRLALLEYEQTPACGIVWADDRIVVTQYLPGRANLFEPGLVLHKTEVTEPRMRRVVTLRRPDQAEQLADVYISAYREIQVSAKPITTERIDALKRARAGFANAPSESVLRSEARKEEQTS